MSLNIFKLFSLKILITVIVKLKSEYYEISIEKFNNQQISNLEAQSAEKSYLLDINLLLSFFYVSFIQLVL